jgi:hypothetical protein
MVMVLTVLSEKQREALVAYLSNIERNDGLDTDLVRLDQVADLIEALNAIDGGDRDPEEYVEMTVAMKSR